MEIIECSNFLLQSSWEFRENGNGWLSKLFYVPLKSANSDIPLVGDEDSSPFGSVLAAVNSQYDQTYEVKKEDCIGHVQKRLCTALRSYKNTGGKGRLTDPIIDRVQTAYVYGMRNNKGDQALKASILIARMMIKSGVSTTKIKYSTQKYMIDQNVYHLCFVVSFMKCLHDCHQQIS